MFPSWCLPPPPISGRRRPWYARTGRPAPSGAILGRALELRPLAGRHQRPLRGPGTALPLAEGAGAPAAGPRCGTSASSRSTATSSRSLTAGLNGWLALQATTLLQEAGLRFDASPVPRWPFWAQVVVFLLVSDFLQWCVHNALHRVRLPLDLPQGPPRDHHHGLRRELPLPLDGDPRLQDGAVAAARAPRGLGGGGLRGGGLRHVLGRPQPREPERGPRAARLRLQQPAHAPVAPRRVGRGRGREELRDRPQPLGLPLRHRLLAARPQPADARLPGHRGDAAGARRRARLARRARR